MGIVCNLTFNKDSSIFKFRDNLLRLCFGKNTFLSDEFNELIKLIKTINFRLRSYGHFKAKNQKLWKITEKNLETLSRFEKIFLEETSFQMNSKEGSLNL